MRIETLDSIAVRAVVFDIGCVLEIVDDRRGGAAVSVDEDMIEFARGLRPRYRTGILDSTVDDARDEEQRCDFADVVDTLVSAREVGVRTPDPAMYRIVERRLGVQGEQVAYIADRPASVTAARAVGWHAILHRGAATTIASAEAVLGRPATRALR